MFPKKTFLIISLALLAGCSANYKNATDYKLCYSHATLPSSNLITNRAINREAEIRSRGLDCGVYSDRIDEEERAKDLERAGATRINKSTTVYQPIQRKNKGVICTTDTNIGYTYCN